MKKIPIIVLLLLSALAEKCFAQWPYFDTVSFEYPVPSISIDSSQGNIWQIAAPGKSYFTGAHTGRNAILTDSLHFYPPNTTSSFIYHPGDLSLHTCLTCMSFWHKYDTDTLADYGMIEVSYDGGSSWLILDDTMSYYIFQWNYDFHESTGAYTQHPLLTTGTSDGWIQSSFCWQWQIFVDNDTIISPPDSLVIRFTFRSDPSADARDGWMIDDMVTHSLEPIECFGGFGESPGASPVSVFPNPFDTQATLQTEVPLRNASLLLYNSMGQRVRQMHGLEGKTLLLDRGDLVNGVYYFRLLQDNQTLATGKVVIAGD